MLSSFRISPSSRKTFRACRRRWWWAKVRGLSEPTTSSLTLGSDVHGILESYLRGTLEASGGVPPSLAGRIAQAGFAVLDGYRHLVRHVEAKLSGMCGPIPYLSYADMVGEAWIGDHKTSKNPRRYGHTPESLGHDPQVLFYARVAFPELPSEVKLTHIYYRTSGTPKAYSVDAVAPAERIEENWAAFEADAAEMLAYSTVTDQADVPFNVSACFAYYRECPFSKVCNRSTQ
jgi:hypothetical protein